MANTVKHIDEGEFAFPTHQILSPSGQVLHPGTDGMTLRDWFAGQALAGLGQWTPGHQFGLSDPEGIKSRSEWAYAHADAMIAARKGGAA